MNEFTLGQAARISWTVKVSGVLTDVASNTLTILTPAGATVTITNGQIVRDSLGAYHYDHEPASAKASEGTYNWRAVSTAPDGSVEGWFTFVPSPFF